MTDDMIEKLTSVFYHKWHELGRVGDGTGFFGGLGFSDFEKEADKVPAKRERYFRNLGCEVSSSSYNFHDTEGRIVIKWVHQRIPSSGTPLSYIFVNIPIDLAEKALVLGLP